MTETPPRSPVPWRGLVESAQTQPPLCYHRHVSRHRPGADLILSMRHVLVASCTPPNGIGHAKQMGRGGEMPMFREFDEELRGRRRYRPMRNNPHKLSPTNGRQSSM